MRKESICLKIILLNSFGAIGRIWKLLHFTSGRVQSWEDYWQDERKYWNADSRDKSRVELYFGNVNTEQNLLLKTQKKFEEYIAYTKHWHGLCKVGEEVQVISIEPNVIALSKNWQGAVADHSDLELHLNQERTFWGKSIRFYCELYSFGTIAAAVSGSMEAAFGEGHWDKRVAHKQNLIDEISNHPVIETYLYSVITPKKTLLSPQHKHTHLFDWLYSILKPVLVITQNIDVIKYFEREANKTLVRNTFNAIIYRDLHCVILPISHLSKKWNDTEMCASRISDKS